MTQQDLSVDADPAGRRPRQSLLRSVASLLPRRLRPRLAIVDLVRRRTGMVVPTGPFAGMRLEPSWPDLPEILGIYEQELWRVVRSLPGFPLARIVNVGAARGYYAVGLARLLPRARVIAFETEDTTRAVLCRTAALNQVEARIEARGTCTPRELAAALAEPGLSLVLCDVEGYERALLDPAAVPGLRQSLVLVELHEHLAPGITAEIRRRFGDSHEVLEIWQTDRTAEDFPYSDWYLRLLPKRYRQWAVDEGRGVRMNWFWMVPR